MNIYHCTVFGGKENKAATWEWTNTWMGVLFLVPNELFEQSFMTSLSQVSKKLYLILF